MLDDVRFYRTFWNVLFSNCYSIHSWWCGFSNSSKEPNSLFCSLIMVWRFFGLGSGCVAFIMAVERFLALTQPFFYCKHITYGLVKRAISIMWLSCALITFAPFAGFGVYFDKKGRKCTRYRDALEKDDVIYAWLLFIFGENSSHWFFHHS